VRARQEGLGTDLIRSLLVFVAFFVGSGFGFVGSALLFRESLPTFTENLADLAWMGCKQRIRGTGAVNIPKAMPGFSLLTLSRCSLAKNM
jgi:hypothetical protein